MADEGKQPQESMMDRLKESPRTVSAIIIILIVAAAIYAFSGDQQNGQPGTTGAAEQTPGAVGTRDEQQPAATGTDTRASETAGERSDRGTAIPAAEKTSQGYVEVAQAGDGITHLSRRATTRWLAENQTDYTVTDEHRIFIEDYIQNRLGTGGLEIGEQVTVSFDLVAEAVAAAQQLNDAQLKNLSQYTYVLQ